MTTKPEPQIWKAAVELWLHHIENDYVEKTLLIALKYGHNDIIEATNYLVTHGYGALLGMYGAGGPGMIHIDVGGDLRKTNFIQVFYPNWSTKAMDISLSDILKYLRNGKREVNVQLSLL